MYILKIDELLHISKHAASKFDSGILKQHRNHFNIYTGATRKYKIKISMIGFLCWTKILLTKFVL